MIVVFRRCMASPLLLTRQVYRREMRHEIVDRLYKFLNDHEEFYFKAEKLETVLHTVTLLLQES
jgi:hypothetical protein